MPDGTRYAYPRANRGDNPVAEVLSSWLLDKQIFTINLIASTARI